MAGGDDRVLACAADLTQEEGLQRVIDDTVARFGGIDVLVNSVGAGPRRRLLETSDDEWQAAFDHTLLPAVRASRLAVPHMTRRGGGSIIIIASIFGREAGGRMTYNAVKAAEISLAKSLAQQLAPSNIRVNSVSPGSFLFEGGSWWKRQQENPAAIAEFVNASCRSAVSAEPTNWATSSLSSPHRVPAGSAARRSWWMAVRVGRSSCGLGSSFAGPNRRIEDLHAAGRSEDSL